MSKGPDWLTIRDHFPNPEFPLSVHWIRQQGPRRVHGHEFEELVVVLGGLGRHRSGGGEWSVRAGDVFVVPRGQTHAYLRTDRLELCNVLFQAERLPFALESLTTSPGYHALFSLEPRWRDGGRGASRLHLNAEQLSETAVLLRRMLRELADGQAGGEMMSLGLFLQLVGTLCRAYGKHPHREGRRLLGLERAMRRIGGLERPAPGLAELADLAGMSVSTFQRAWRRYAGKTAADYLLELRMNRARLLLETTSLSVSEISAMAGFEDSNYFSRRFRMENGLSPRGWRARCRDNPV